MSTYPNPVEEKTLTADEVHRFLRSPALVARRLQQMTDLSFVADQLLTGTAPATGPGAIMGGVSFVSQLLGTLLGLVIAVVGALVIYGVMRQTVGLRLTQEEEHNGADLAIHKISATAHEVQI